MYQVYRIQSSKTGLSYIGYTNNLKRRVRQHNGELKGGAKMTASAAGSWKLVENISAKTQKEAKSFESRLHVRTTRELKRIDVKDVFRLTPIKKPDRKETVVVKNNKIPSKVNIDAIMTVPKSLVNAKILLGFKKNTQLRTIALNPPRALRYFLPRSNITKDDVRAALHIASLDTNDPNRLKMRNDLVRKLRARDRLQGSEDRQNVIAMANNNRDERARLRPL